MSVSVAAEDDVAELLRRIETRLSDDGEVVLLRLNRWCTAQSAVSDLGVLRLDGGVDLIGRDAVEAQLVRVEPDSHRVLSAEHDDVADAVKTGNRLLEVRDHVVREVARLVLVVRGDERNGHQE